MRGYCVRVHGVYSGAVMKKYKILKAIWCQFFGFAHDYQTYEVRGLVTYNRCADCGAEMTYHARKEPFIFGGRK